MQNQMAQEKQLDIDEVIQLSHIREVRDFFALKIEELKAGNTRELIDDYLNKKSNYHRVLFKEVVGKEDRKKGDTVEEILAYEEEPSLYWFVLTRYKDWTWQVTEMEPTPLSYEIRLHILPIDIMALMADESEVNPDQIHTPDPVYSKKSRSFYNIKYVRFSSNTIFGVVRENLQLKNEKYANINVSPEEKMDAALDILFRAISEHPPVARMFIDGMFEYALPYLVAEEKLAEINKTMERLDIAP